MGLVMAHNRPTMKLLLALREPYFDQFVGEEIFAPVRPLYTEIRRVDPSTMSLEQWQALFADFAPNAVLTCWGTPFIPASALPTLGHVAHLCGSVRHLVNREMIENGLRVTNWGTIHAPIVAECALMLVLTCLRRMTRWSFSMHRDHQWPHEAIHSARSLYGRRVGIHGFGQVARNVVKLLKPFGCPIKAYSAGVPQQVYLDNGVTPAGSLEALFMDTEVLIDVEALTPSTEHTVSETLLRLLPRGAVFVNVGRGAVVDEAALIRVAKEGGLEIGLDVYETEPPPANSPLFGLPNVSLSPHIGGPTADQWKQCGRLAVDNLIRFARGETLQNMVTPVLFDRAT